MSGEQGIDPIFEGPSASKCKLARCIDLLDDERQEKLKVALEKKDVSDPTRFVVSAERIVSVLHEWGYSVCETTVKTHRRKVCACAR